MNFQINKRGKNTRKSLVLTILVFLTSSSLAYALTPYDTTRYATMTPDEENSFALFLSRSHSKRYKEWL
jgi:hypothetical protein